MTLPSHELQLNVSRFTHWLKKQGALIEAPTSQYELLRYLYAGRTAIIYRNERGRLRYYNGADEDYRNMLQGKAMSVRAAAVGKIKSHRKATLREELLRRDGPACWFCEEEMSFGEDPTHPRAATIEHLWARSNGGPNHRDNLVLCCYECNGILDSKGLVEKLKLRDDRRKA